MNLERSHNSQSSLILARQQVAHWINGWDDLLPETFVSWAGNSGELNFFTVHFASKSLSFKKCVEQTQNFYFRFQKTPPKHYDVQIYAIKQGSTQDF